MLCMSSTLSMRVEVVLNPTSPPPGRQHRSSLIAVHVQRELVLLDVQTAGDRGEQVTA
jgi:hypothetical protein